MGNIPQSAKKLAEKIKEGNGKPVAVQSKDILDAAPGKITSNEMMLARRSIMFASDVPIIAEKQRTSGSGKRAGSKSVAYFRALTPEEFKSHQFVQENFQRLSHDDINRIINRILMVKPETDMKGLLQYLVVCDLIVQFKGQGHFVQLSRSVIACSLMESREKVEELLNDLVQAGIVSRFRSRLRYNSIFEDIGSQPTRETKEPLMKKEAEAAPEASKSEDKFHKYIRLMSSEYETTAEQLEIYKIRLNETLEKLGRLQEDYALLKEKADGFTVMASSYGKQNQAYKDLKKKTDAQEKEIERYRKILKDGGQRMEVHIETFTQGVTHAMMNYEADHKAGKFTTSITSLIADLNRGLGTIYPKR